MKAVDFIVKHIEDQGMTQAEAAAKAGWSRQNFWDKLNNRNPRFNTMTHILTSFGFEIHAVREDGNTADFDEQNFFSVAQEKNIYYDDLEALMIAMGYRLNITEKPEK